MKMKWTIRVGLLFISILFLFLSSCSLIELASQQEDDSGTIDEPAGEEPAQPAGEEPAQPAAADDSDGRNCGLF